MILRVRLFNLKRRPTIRHYINDVRETLAVLRCFAHPESHWREASSGQSVLPTDEDGLARLFMERPVRNNVGRVMEDMGYSVAAFLDTAPPRDIYVSFDVAVRSPRTEEGILGHIPSEIVKNRWDSLIGLFCSLVLRWSPQLADVMNLESLDVVCDELGDRVPVGFACYAEDLRTIKPPEFATTEKVGEGTLLYLQSPRFDSSREEGARLRAISDLLLVARERSGA